MNNIWLIGAGPMAEAYYYVLEQMNVDVNVIGRNPETAIVLSKKIGHNVLNGGLGKFLKTNPSLPDAAIVAVGVEALADACRELISAGVKKILVEKPAGLNSRDIKSLYTTAESDNVQIYVAYNRRFYASVQRALELIENDGGVVSFNFEFTEWSQSIGPLKKAEGVKEQWLLGNSTHVIDLAFFLGGTPKELVSFSGGENELDWHPSACRYSGAGISKKGALFSYFADWCAPGRWSVEILTRTHKFIFRPMEKLGIQDINTVVIYDDESIDYSFDEKFKPGLYKQVDAFLHRSDNTNLCSLSEHIENLKYYKKIANKLDF